MLTLLQLSSPPPLVNKDHGCEFIWPTTCINNTEKIRWINNVCLKAEYFKKLVSLGMNIILKLIMEVFRRIMVFYASTHLATFQEYI